MSAAAAGRPAVLELLVAGGPAPYPRAMARYERDPRAEGGKVDAADGKIRMRRDENGRLVPVRQESEPGTATTEAAERPPFPDDPRPGGGMPGGRGF